MAAPAIPQRHFLWPSVLRQIGSAEHRVCNMQRRSMPLLARRLNSPLVPASFINMTDQLRCSSIYNISKGSFWRRMKAESELQCQMPLRGILLKWMGKEGDEAGRAETEPPSAGLAGQAARQAERQAQSCIQAQVPPTLLRIVFSIFHLLLVNLSNGSI